MQVIFSNILYCIWSFNNIVFCGAYDIIRAHLTDRLGLFLGIDVNWSLIHTSKCVILWIVPVRNNNYELNMLKLYSQLM